MNLLIDKKLAIYKFNRTAGIWTFFGEPIVCLISLYKSWTWNCQNTEDFFSFSLPFFFFFFAFMKFLSLHGLDGITSTKKNFNGDLSYESIKCYYLWPVLYTSSTWQSHKHLILTVWPIMIISVAQWCQSSLS